MRGSTSVVFLVAAALAGCDGANTVSTTHPAPTIRSGLVVYDSDTALTRTDLAELASPGAVFEALDPNADKSSEFVKSGYETSEAFTQRIAGITGDQRRYVLVVPARLEYDADSQQASFCPKEPIATVPECVYGSPDRRHIQLGGWAAGAFTGQWKLDVSANKFKTSVVPIKLSVNAVEARRAEDAKNARLAFVFTLDHSLKNLRFAETTGLSIHDTASRANVTLRRVVAYEQGGSVLGSRDF